MTNNKVKNATSEKKGIIGFFKGVKNEFKKIVWPSKEETKKAFIAVIGFAIIYVILVGGFDFIFQSFFEVVFKLK